MDKLNSVLKLVQSRAVDDHRARSWEEAQRRDEARSWLKRSGLPVTDEDLERLAAGSLAETDAVAAVRAFLASKKPYMLLLGATGRGKTVACGLAIRELGGGHAIQAARLVRAATDFDETEYRRLETTRVLVIDDLGLEEDPERFANLLCPLLDARASRGRKTLMTCNKAPDPFKDRYRSDRLWSRFSRLCMEVVVTGPDLRRQL